MHAHEQFSTKTTTNSRNPHVWLTRAEGGNTCRSSSSSSKIQFQKSGSAASRLDLADQDVEIIQLQHHVERQRRDLPLRVGQLEARKARVHLGACNRDNATARSMVNNTSSTRRQRRRGFKARAHAHEQRAHRQTDQGPRRRQDTDKPQAEQLKQQSAAHAPAPTAFGEKRCALPAYRYARYATIGRFRNTDHHVPNSCTTPKRQTEATDRHVGVER